MYKYNLREFRFSPSYLVHNFRRYAIYLALSPRQLKRCVSTAVYSNIYPTRCNVTQFTLSGNSSICYGRYHYPKHVEQFPDKINCVTLHLVRYIITMHGPMNVKSIRFYFLLHVSAIHIDHYQVEKYRRKLSQKRYHLQNKCGKVHYILFPKDE